MLSKLTNDDHAMRGGSRVIEITAWVLLFSIASVIAVFRARLWHNHDISWLSLASERMLNGATLGRDILELNPPLIMWIMAPSAWLGDFYNADFFIVYNIMFTATAFMSSVLVMQITKQVTTKPRAILTSIATLLILIVPIGYEFGQRDHLSFLFIVPYLFIESTKGYSGRHVSLDVLCAVLASIGLLLKPQYGLVPAGFLLMNVISGRSVFLRSWHIYLSMFACALMYVVVVLLFYKDWLELTKLTMRLYSAYNATYWDLIRVFSSRAVILFLGTAVLLSIRPRNIGITMSIRLTAAAALLLAAGMLQLKGWSYHLIPGCLGLTLAFSVYFTTSNYKEWLVGWQRFAIGFLLSILVIVFARSITKDIAFHREAGLAGLADMRRIMRGSDSSSFLALSTSIFPVFPAVVDEHVTWGSRSPAQWIVPGAVRLQLGDARSKALGLRMNKLVSNLVSDDLLMFKPAIVVVQHSDNQAMPKEFDWVAFLSKTQRFRKVWLSYCLTEFGVKWSIYHRCRP